MCWNVWGWAGAALEGLGMGSCEESLDPSPSASLESGVTSRLVQSPPVGLGFIDLSGRVRLIPGGNIGRAEDGEGLGMKHGPGMEQGQGCSNC